MKLNQNILSPHNNFNKVDVSQLTVSVANKPDSVDTESYLAARLLDHYKYSKMPSGYEDQLKYLDRKIEATRKTISSWESYRISAVAESEEELRQKLGTLQSNTGLVVNALESASVNINNQSYSRGDIIFKDINNQQHIIRSYSGGYYFPAQLMELTKSTISDGSHTTDSTGDGSQTTNSTGSYELWYKYATSLPSEKSEANIGTDVALDEPASIIKAKITLANSATSYGISMTVNKNEDASDDIENGLKAIVQKGVLIYPVVAWTLIANDRFKGERVYFDEEYIIRHEGDGTNSIHLINSTSFESLKVEVR